MSTIHAHVETDSRDCDGRYQSLHMSTARDGENRETFWERLVDLYAEEHGDTIECGPEVFEQTTMTEEGYRNVHLSYCEDPDCDPERDSGYRDHTAEAAGY